MLKLNSAQKAYVKTELGEKQLPTKKETERDIDAEERIGKKSAAALIQVYAGAAEAPPELMGVISKFAGAMTKEDAPVLGRAAFRREIAQCCSNLGEGLGRLVGHDRELVRMLDVAGGQQLLDWKATSRAELEAKFKAQSTDPMSEISVKSRLEDPAMLRFQIGWSEIDKLTQRYNVSDRGDGLYFAARATALNNSGVFSMESLLKGYHRAKTSNEGFDTITKEYAPQLVDLLVRAANDKSSDGQVSVLEELFRPQRSSKG